jgi:hypothetical protein
VTELELTRSPNDRRLYEVEGVGTLRSAGFPSRRATAETADGVWSFNRRFWKTEMTAIDVDGAEVGSFSRGKTRRGGSLRWRGRELELRPASKWKERYALADGDRELATFEAKGWGKRPVRILVDEPSQVDSGLLLFAAYSANQLAEDAAAIGGGAIAASAGG